MDRAAALALIVTMTLGCGESTLPDDIEVVDVRSGAQSSFDAMVEDLMQARAIYVGEQHDQEAHHALQAAIVRAIHARDPSIAVGVEMIQRPFQQAVDDYVAGRIDEDELLERVEWRTRWGFDFAMYRPVFDYARQNRIAIVAANAPKEITRAIGRGGLDALAAEDRAALAELDLGSERHRAMVRDALSGHGGMDDAMLERFYTAQVVWDETMAEAVADKLAAPGAPRRIVVLAGDMHVREGLGIPERAARRGATPYRIVLPVGADEDLAAEPRAADWLVILPDTD